MNRYDPRARRWAGYAPPARHVGPATILGLVLAQGVIWFIWRPPGEAFGSYLGQFFGAEAVLLLSVALVLISTLPWVETWFNGIDRAAVWHRRLGFESKEPVDYDYRDEDAQKQLLAERSKGLGWVVPQILEHMKDAAGFHFDARIQVIMDHWTRGRVALVGDAGYAVSLTTGQGASMAMVGAYVLAGEIASATGDPVAGIARYEDELRDYVLRNQAAARQLNDQNQSDGDPSDPGDFTDFGTMIENLQLKDYPAAPDRP